MMDFETSVISVALFALLVPAVAFDVQKNKIPNLLVFPFWLLSPLLYLSLSGLSGLGMSLAGLGVAFVTSLLRAMPPMPMFFAKKKSLKK